MLVSSENDDKQNENQNEGNQKSFISSIQTQNNDNKYIQTEQLNSPEETENKNVIITTENQNNQSKHIAKDKEFLDEDGNLLDPKDLSFNSEEDKSSIIVFDMEINFIKNITQIDIVFLLDTSKSVNPYIKGIKRYIRKLLFDARKSISHYLSDDFDILNYGLVAYRDHDQENVQGSYVSKILCELNEDYNLFRQALYNIECSGGDDTCEAVIDGLHEAVNLIKWREDSIKLLYHICEAPCHGSEYNGRRKVGKSYDKYSGGCPCGMNMKNILRSLRGKYIEYNLIALNDDIRDMANKFSDYIKVELVDLNIGPEEGISGDQRANDN